MDEASTVEQDVDRPGLRRELADGGLVEHIELARDDPLHALQRFELPGIDVGRPYPGAFACESPCRGRTDPLSRGRDDAGLALQAHFNLPGRALLDDALFLVEFLRPRMQRNPQALQRVFQADDLALGMARVEELAGVGVPQCRRDGIDQSLGLLDRRHPDGVHAHRLDAGRVLVGVVGYLVRREEAELLHQSVRLRTVNRHEVDAGRHSQFRDCTVRPSTHAEKGIEGTVLELVGRLLGLQVLRLHVLLGEPVSGQDQPRIDQGPRPRLVERQTLALQVHHRLDAGALAGDELEAFGIEARDRPQPVRLGTSLVNAGAGIGPVGHVRLHEAGLHRAGGNGIDVGDRAVRGDRRGDETRYAAGSAVGAGTGARRVRNGVGDQAADREIGPGRGAGADAEKGDVLRPGRHRAEGGGTEASQQRSPAIDPHGSLLALDRLNRVPRGVATLSAQLTPIARLNVGPISS